MARYNHMAGLKIVGECSPCADNRVLLTDEKDEFGLPVPRIEFSWSDNDKRLIEHAKRFMRRGLELAGGRDVFTTDSTAHMMGGCRMGNSPADSVVDADCRSWDIPNLWICDGSVFPTSGGVNPSMTIMAIAARTADRISDLARRGEL